MTEQLDLKKKFGKLGLYLVDKANQKIKEIHSQTLFQKAEVRKEYSERLNEESLKLKNNFIEKYNEILNTQITRTLLESKEKILNLKNRLLKELKLYIYDLLKERIEKEYSSYIDNLVEKIKTLKLIIEKSEEVKISFNLNDYNYFKKNIDKIQKLFNTSVEILKSSNSFIGGFIISIDNGLMSYDFTINTIINKNDAVIEMVFSDITADSKYKEIEIEFEKLIKEKKSNIDEYLIEYDEIK